MDNFRLIKYEAYEQKFNLSLFNEMVAFILGSTEQRNDDFKYTIKRECMWYEPYTNTIPERLGFRYPGEMLERYEERCGNDIKDIRAMAMALGYTSQVHETSMFIGGQKSDFIYKIRRMSDNDFYLQLALYYLEGQKADRFNSLVNMDCTATEEILLQVWLYADSGSGFETKKQQLIKAFTTDRTISAINNAGLFAGLLVNFEYSIKACRAKDAAIFKKLVLLKDSLIKPDSKDMASLQEYGYTADEIRYLNYVLADYLDLPSKLKSRGITDEKIAVEFCKHFLNLPQTHSENLYGLIFAVLTMYCTFDVKYEENEGIYQALMGDVDITNPMTYARTHRKISSTFVEHFDMLDSKWDILSTELEYGPYWAFVSDKVLELSELETIKAWLEKFKTLTGKDFIARYEESTHISTGMFAHLVTVGYINLMQYYEEMLTYPVDDEAAYKKRDNRRYYICNKVRKVDSREDFEFFREFFSKYGNFELKDELGISDFHTSFTIHYSYSGKNLGTLNIKRDFLSDDEHREIVGWIENHLFEQHIDKYCQLAELLLKDSFIRSIFSKDEMRELYLGYASVDEEAANDIQLVRMYLSDEEIQRFEDREAEKKRIAELEEYNRDEQKCREAFAEYSDSWERLHRLYSRYHYGNEKKIYKELIREKIDCLIRTMPITNKEEFSEFFSFEKSVLGYDYFNAAEILDHIILAKEYMNYETDNTEIEND